MNKENKKCLLCGENKKLIKSHILPKCFRKYLTSNGESVLLKDTYHKGIIKKEFIKNCDNNIIFDKNILCAECDNSFSTEEKSLFNFCKKMIDTNPTVINLENNEEVKLESVGINSIYKVGIKEKELKNIKLALLFLLYKLAISKTSISGFEEEDKEIEEELRDALITKELKNIKLLKIKISYNKSLSFLNIQDKNKERIFFERKTKNDSGGRFITTKIPGFFIDYELLKECLKIEDDHLNFLNILNQKEFIYFSTLKRDDLVKKTLKEPLNTINICRSSRNEKRKMSSTEKKKDGQRRIKCIKLGPNDPRREHLKGLRNH